MRAVSFNAFFPNDPATNAHVDVQDDHFQVVRDIGAASTVLLKNVAGALPLRKPRSIAIIGALLMLMRTHFCVIVRPAVRTDASLW